jgi:hypothetical protein
MRILLDECLPRRLKDEFTGHEARTVPDVGWSGRKNDDLLTMVAGQFEAFITIDGGIEHQQDLSSLAVGVIALRAKSNRLEDLRPLVPQVLAALPSLKPGDWVVLGR